MTKRDYELIAAVIATNCRDCHTWSVADERIEGIAEDMADAFEAVDPRFDRKRFLQACGLD